MSGGEVMAEAVSGVEVEGVCRAPEMRWPGVLEGG